VARATGLCRPATRRTAQERQFEPMGMAFSLGLVLLVRLFYVRLFPPQISNFDKVGLLSLGLSLLLAVSWVTFAIFLVVAIFSYVGLAWIMKYHARRAPAYLLILIPLELTPLAYYKYADFLANQVMHLQMPFFH